jgi:hypothetical protein
MVMAPAAPKQWEEDWKVAEEALRKAQAMPAGPDRVAALMQAGKMRFDASMSAPKEGANNRRPNK